MTGSKSSVSSAWPNMPFASAALTADVLILVVSRSLGRSSLGLHVSYGLARLHLSAGYDRAECVEDAVAGLPCDIGGQIAIAGLHHVSRQLPRDVRRCSRACRTLR